MTPSFSYLLSPSSLEPTSCSSPYSTHFPPPFFPYVYPVNFLFHLPSTILPELHIHVAASEIFGTLVQLYPIDQVANKGVYFIAF